MTHEDKIIEEFKMFVPEDDGSATDWIKNTLTTYRAQVLEEEQLITKKDSLDAFIKAIDAVGVEHIRDWTTTQIKGLEHPTN